MGKMPPEAGISMSNLTWENRLTFGLKMANSKETARVDRSTQRLANSAWDGMSVETNKRNRSSRWDTTYTLHATLLGHNMLALLKGADSLLTGSGCEVSMDFTRCGFSLKKYSWFYSSFWLNKEFSQTFFWCLSIKKDVSCFKYSEINISCMKNGHISSWSDVSEVPIKR